MKASKDTSIRKVIIAGSGIEAWLTAATLLKNLGRTNTEIMVCPVPGSDELDPLYSLIPDIENDVLRSLGVSNLGLVRTCQASFSMGIRYTGLSTTDFDQFRPYGGIGIDFLGGAFVHHWLRNSRNIASRLTASDYFSYSTAYEAARKNTFAPPVKLTAVGPLQHQIARHVDVSLLTSLLRSRVLSNGVTESAGELKSVERSAGSSRIEKLVTNNEEILQADLYIDCSGGKRSLISGAIGTEWIPAPFSPHYQVHFKIDAAVSTQSPYHLVSALSSGWQVTVPGFGWQLTMNLIEKPASSDSIAFQPGYLSEPWSENCVALGTAAASILPVDTFQAKFLMAGLKRLLTLLPGANCAATETTEFNHLCVEDSREVAGLSALYEIARQQGSIDPVRLADMGIPKSLKKRLALFHKRGWVASLDTDLVNRSDWSASFILLGLFPAQHDLVVERIPADKLKQSLHDLKVRIGKVASEYPPLGVYLDAVKSSPGRKSANE